MIQLTIIKNKTASKISSKYIGAMILLHEPKVGVWPEYIQILPVQPLITYTVYGIKSRDVFSTLILCVTLLCVVIVHELVSKM